MARTRGARDKKKRNVKRGLAIGAASLAGAGAIGAGLYFGSKSFTKPDIKKVIRDLEVGSVARKTESTTEPFSRKFLNTQRVKKRQELLLDETDYLKRTRNIRKRNKSMIADLEQQPDSSYKTERLAVLKNRNNAGDYLQYGKEKMKKKIMSAGANYSSNSETANFARTRGAKDKKKRKLRNALIAGAGLLGTAAVAGGAYALLRKKGVKPNIPNMKYTSRLPGSASSAESTVSSATKKADKFAGSKFAALRDKLRNAGSKEERLSLAEEARKLAGGRNRVGLKAAKDANRTSKLGARLRENPSLELERSLQNTGLLTRKGRIQSGLSASKAAGGKTSTQDLWRGTAEKTTKTPEPKAPVLALPDPRGAKKAANTEKVYRRRQQIKAESRDLKSASMGSGFAKESQRRVSKMDKRTKAYKFEKAKADGYSAEVAEERRVAKENLKAKLSRLKAEGKYDMTPREQASAAKRAKNTERTKRRQAAISKESTKLKESSGAATRAGIFGSRQEAAQAANNRQARKNKLKRKVEKLKAEGNYRASNRGIANFGRRLGSKDKRRRKKH